MYNTIEHIAWTPIHLAIYGLAHLIKRNPKIWVFGAWQGNVFSDNSMYLYKYVSKTHSDIKAVWITHRKILAQKLREDGYCAYSFHELKGIYYSLIAGAAFTSSGVGDVASWACYGIQHYELWHGFPLKRIGLDAIGWKKNNANKRNLKYLLPYVKRKDYNTKHFVCSPENARLIQSSFGIDSTKTFVTGYPRVDIMKTRIKIAYFEAIKKKNPGVKFACYLPTHRNFGSKGKQILTPELLSETDELLRKKNIILIFKPHYHELKNYIHENMNYTNIILGINNSIFDDACLLMSQMDLLICDYSSAIVDWMVTKKPIVYFPYDLDDYLKSDAGMYYNYADIAAGEICKDWSQVIKTTIDLLSDKWKITEKYLQLNSLFNTYDDGQNCKRVTDFVIKDLKS